MDQLPPAIAPSAEHCLSAKQAAELVVLRSNGGRLTAVIAPAPGGALVGLQREQDGGPVELLHRGMNFCPTPGFDGKAPMLWPATGRTYAGDDARAGFGWMWQGRRYPMPLHGFARNQPWQLVSVRRQGRVAEAVLRLTDSAATRAFYPFAFTTTATYRLGRDALEIRYRVTAGANDAAMPFAIGNHVTFALPLGGAGTAAETTVTTRPGTRLSLDAAGRPAGRTPQPPLEQVPVATLGKEIAVPLAGYGPGTATATLAQPGWGAIRITNTATARATGDPVRFTLWGDAAAGYYAVEPWLGLQNGLASGEGTVRLAPGRSMEWTMRLAITAR